ncbi:hypothetical protein ACFOOK_26145 [Micromonospora krabiensis]|uniref:Uncharacterized protein n=1 Tax=Micromonospora krabiensis TaxID=307121 RepID=A0A1C3N5W8_9ACTN|nr:hypothetical protein [Micromonospora krabiensis]SBV27953.1 hypothetical protein GA0070620_3484 [Micromonospora krabiensis]
MRFTPRKEEVQPVIDILESDDFDSADDMAKALIREVVDMLWFRDWHVLVVNRDGQAVAFGPFASEPEAKALGTKWQGTLLPGDPTRWGVVPVRGLGATAEERQGGGYGFCTTEGCGHPAYAHSMDGSARGYCIVCGRHGACEKYAQAAKKKTRAKAT